MKRKREKPDKGSENRQASFIMMAVTVALILFAGIVPAETGNLSTNAEATQSATGTVTYAHVRRRTSMAMMWSRLLMH